jgi:N-methylhydantoinase A
VDVGGTFTDVAVADTASGAIGVAKVASTPANQSLGFMRALNKAGIAPADLEVVMHGTTVATNAVLEGKGARVGMLVTAGFRDVLEIGRGERSKLYDLKLAKQPPLVPRSARFEVRERTRADGTIAEVREPRRHAVRCLDRRLPPLLRQSRKRGARGALFARTGR